MIFIPSHAQRLITARARIWDMLNTGELTRMNDWIQYPQKFIPSEPNLQPTSGSFPTLGTDLGGNKTTPVRSVQAGPLYFECWLEEGKFKEFHNIPDSDQMDMGMGTEDPP